MGGERESLKDRGTQSSGAVLEKGPWAISPSQAPSQLAERFATLGIDLAKTQVNDKGTLLQGYRVDGDSWVEALPSLSLGEEATRQVTQAVRELVVGETLGEGGMGVVQSAHQGPLARDVAIKRLRPQPGKPPATMALLREAWITGMLDHPNIVPVYMLGRDKGGQPVLVMKRIEGVSWQALMGSPSHPLRQEDKRLPLLWELDVLMQVCRAVHFAHSRGILHRDLKPDNVMIGEFGEVYVVDWGIAVALSAHEKLPLPLASGVKALEGTPHYMAPEMVHVVAEMLGPATDVYLLGAILHQILTGAPPHQGATLMAVLSEALLSAPHRYPAESPRALVEICQRAMHPDPRKRFVSAEAFRQAIADFLQQRSSMELAEEAQRELSQIEADEAHDASGRSPVSPESLDEALEVVEEDRRFVWSQLTAARIGFSQALRLWSENEMAQRGAQQVLERMFYWQLDQGYLDAAEAVLAEMDEPPQALLSALERARDDARREQDRIARLRHETDRKIGRRTRRFLMFLFMVASVPFWLSFGELFGGRQMTYGWFVGHMAGFSVLSLGLITWARETLMRNQVNRRLVIVLWSFILINWGGIFYGIAMGLPVLHVIAMTLLLQTMALAAAALLTELLLLWCLPIGGVFLAWIVWKPSWICDLMALYQAISMSLAVLLWRPAEMHPRMVARLERWRAFWARWH